MCFSGRSLLQLRKRIKRQYTLQHLSKFSKIWLYPNQKDLGFRLTGRSYFKCWLAVSQLNLARKGDGPLDVGGC